MTAVSERTADRSVDGRHQLCLEQSGGRGDVLEFVTEDESQSTMHTLPGRSMRIANGRLVETSSIERDLSSSATRVSRWILRSISATPRRCARSSRS